MTMIRPPAVAGRFYPDDPVSLRKQVLTFLGEKSPDTRPVCGLIVPHAGYIFSGQVAARAYHSLLSHAKRIKHVILIGPSHYVPFQGCAVPGVDAFSTPVGMIPLDRPLLNKLCQNDNVHISDHAHQHEHSLEVQLPFLQLCLADFTLVPIVFGQIEAQDVARLINSIWDPCNTLLVISTDLSHFHQYEDAHKIDTATCALIEDGQAIVTHKQACGATGVNAFLLLNQFRGYQLTRQSLINSGDTEFGDKHRVVGYVSYTITQH
jgi:AmmeMemoRadiSam system protein B